MRDYFKNWDFKKHATTVTTIYAILYFLDMTLGYVVAKKILNKSTKDKRVASR
ncbi:MAG: hypothetical protein PHW03_02335 [Eubacteriales bacterium]|nr:hypothetical protein [Eubacteriales bacterium]MDD4389621.1 hypothetical protein [Eubacteriales bacterium]